jgi:hypothetical protein
MLPEKSVCGLIRPATTMASAPAACHAHFDHVHRACDRCAYRSFGDAQSREHVALAGRGSAAVRTHRRDEKRFAADIAHRRRQAAQERGGIGDPAAARRNRDARAAADAAPKDMRERVVRCVLRIGDRRSDERVAHDAGLDCVHGSGFAKKTQCLRVDQGPRASTPPERMLGQCLAPSEPATADVNDGASSRS